LASILSAEDAKEDALPGRIEEESRRTLLMRALETLPPRDRRVLILYFGRDGGEPMTLNQIAGMLGVMRKRVRQLPGSGGDGDSAGADGGGAQARAGCMTGEGVLPGC
jgi:DNA-directed RNA polymerase specialized sigma subunit